MKTIIASYSSTGTVDKLIDALLRLNVAGTALTARKILTPNRPPLVLPEAPADGTPSDGTSADRAKPDGAMVKAAFAAMLALPEKIEMPGGELAPCDRLVACMPVWAGSPPPAITTFLRRAKLRGIEVGAIIVPKEDAGNTARRIERIVRKKGGIWLGATIIRSGEVMAGDIETAYGAELRALLGGHE
jgi:hypothetical protein